jgi:hypothetical protein
MYQLLFVIHGMGAGARPADDPNWWTGVVDELRALAKPHGHQNDLVLKSPKAGQILVVPITYHQFFDEIRAKWTAESPDGAFLPLLEKLAFSDPAVLTKLPGWVTTAGEFFWTHVLDVLLYRFTNDFRAPIRTEVADQIAEAWVKADLENGAPTPVHFVAHSLGTSVLHDSIGLLAADPGFSPGTHQISSLVTCANVASVLETNFPAYVSADRPVDAPPAGGGMTAVFLSFRHELDPIAAVKTFRGDLHGWPPTSYADEVPIDVKDWNVHGYTHYLDNPVVHFPVFEQLWPSEPWVTRKPDAIKQYKAAPGTPCPVAIAKARQQLKEILTKPHPETPVGLIDVIAEVVRVIGDAKTACAQEKGT